MGPFEWFGELGLQYSLLVLLYCYSLARFTALFLCSMNDAVGISSAIWCCRIAHDASDELRWSEFGKIGGTRIVSGTRD